MRKHACHSLPLTQAQPTLRLANRERELTAEATVCAPEDVCFAL